MQWIITPQPALLDDRITIQLLGLTPGKKIKIRASLLDDRGQRWTSWAIFRVNATGCIDLTEQAPLSGTYDGIDQDGLFWSMMPDKKTSPPSLFTLTKLNPVTVKLAAFKAGRLIGEHEIIRHIHLLPSVVRTEIHEEKVAGLLFLPGQQSNYPALVMIPGPGGVGSLEGSAALLAAKGYAVLVLAYYRYKNLPQDLYELPLERFRDGIQWLQSHPQIDAARVAAMGVSKGAEALLATLSYLPDQHLKAVILQSPSHVVWQGLGMGRPQHKASWTLFHEPLFYLYFTRMRLGIEMLKRHFYQKLKLDRWLVKGCAAVKTMPAYKKALKNKTDEAEARIPVERIQSKLLLISGTQDDIWPSSMMCQKIKSHLAKVNFGYHVQHLDFPGAGHVIRYPGLPTTVGQSASAKFIFSMGGQPKQVAKANRQYWDTLLTFLNEL